MDPHAELRNLVARWAQVAHADAPEAAREVLAARDLRDALEEVYVDAGAAAHDNGLSWAGLAGILGLSGGGSAHFLFGDGRTARLEKHRRRMGDRTPRAPAAPEVPGIPLPEAAARLGISESTLRRRIDAGKVQATQITTPGGRTRWIVDEAELPKADG
ncbi:MAG: hypothetical protein QM628_15620 [Propionicimonas sp.]